MKEKICSKCSINQPITNFYKQKRGKYGVTAKCIACTKLKNKEYRKGNALILKQKQDIYYENNKEKVKITNKKSYEKHRIKRLLQIKQYDKANRNRKNLLAKEKRKNNSAFKLKTNIKRSIQQVLKSNKFVKRSKTLHTLGCSAEFFKNYIQEQWQKWMTWENYGKYKKGEQNYGWDLDHIIPISSAKTEEDILKLNHYTNFQPLCSYINRYIKKDKL